MLLSPVLHPPWISSFSLQTFSQPRALQNDHFKAESDHGHAAACLRAQVIPIERADNLGVSFSLVIMPRTPGGGERGSILSYPGRPHGAQPTHGPARRMPSRSPTALLIRPRESAVTPGRNKPPFPHFLRMALRPSPASRASAP